MNIIEALKSVDVVLKSGYRKMQWDSEYKLWEVYESKAGFSNYKLILQTEEEKQAVYVLLNGMTK